MIKDFKSVEDLPPFKQLAELAGKVSPNQITLFGFACSLFAAGLLLKGSFFLASLATALHLLCDGLDGYVARKQNRATRFGFLLDHILDRLSDLLLFPVAGLVTGELLLGVLVGIVCLFSSYIGVLNRAIGGAQDKGGLFAKTYRYQLLILLFLACGLFPGLRQDLYGYFCQGALLIGLMTVAERTKALFEVVLSQES